MANKILLLSIFTLSVAASCVTTPDPEPVRFASFNIAMGLSQEGELLKRLESGEDERLAQVAEILQRVRPDVVLLNEFDYSEQAILLLLENYLQKPWSGQTPIHYEFSFTGPSNTGVDSGLDLDGNGQQGGPNDAWGFGFFPGQYGMAVLSRFPIDTEAARIFRHFRWADMPDAQRPVWADGSSYYPEEIWSELRLSSKSHWDLPVRIGKHRVHFLVSHPTPPVFDGPEDRNGRRNFDEIRFWADYIEPANAAYIYDDDGGRGGLAEGARFVIAGDLNADPSDGDSRNKAIRQLLENHAVNLDCVPQSRGAAEASRLQGGVNHSHGGDPARDTADFSDQSTGNLRLDYVLPSRTVKVQSCGVFWPAEDEAGHELATVSDHHLVWINIEF